MKLKKVEDHGKLRPRRKSASKTEKSMNSRIVRTEVGASTAWKDDAIRWDTSKRKPRTRWRRKCRE